MQEEVGEHSLSLLFAVADDVDRICDNSTVLLTPSPPLNEH